MPDVLTIRETVARAKAEEICISESALRRWIKSGAIPVRKVGNKNLIYYPRLLAYLRCEDGGDNSPATAVVAGIRRVDVV